MARKIIKNILIVIAVIIIAIGILYAFNGSLEAFPTDEQQGKSRMAAGVMILLGVIVGVAGAFIKPRGRKK